MRSRINISIIIAIVALSESVALAQSNSKWPLKLPQGTQVTLKIPYSAISLEKVSRWSGKYSYTISVDESGAVGGNANWKELGWASQLILYVNKVEKKKEYTQVELDDVNGNHIKLRFEPSVKDVDAALLDLVHVGNLQSFESSEYYQKEVADRFLPRVFDGPLAAVPRELQLRLIKVANYDFKAIGGETYKGRFYMVIRSTHSDIYNTIQLNQPARVARAIEKDILLVMKGMYKVLSGVEGIDGFKIELRVGHKNFVSEQYADPNYDDLHVYANKEVIKKFAEDDITSQQFVNDSIILVNGNRVDVSLTQFK